jgi:thiol-disulfide isomerase/thioredoxin
MKRHIVTGLAALLLVVPAASAASAHLAADTLGAGDVAPRLSAVEWIKGAPVSEWKPGQVYVIDFWATWCGPCKASIPHVNELAKHYRDSGVTFIGAAIWPRKGMVPTDEFVADKGDDMDYRIAADIDGATAETFMRAAGQKGIPTAMLIDKQGKLAWIGHPLFGLDEALAAVVEDRFDPVALEKELAEKQAAENEVRGALTAAIGANDWDTAAAQVVRLIDMNAMRYAGYGTLGYSAYLKAGKPAEAAAWGRKLVGGLYAKNSSSLNGLAWTIVDPEGDITPVQRDLQLARLAADLANKLSLEKDASILDTVARVAFLQGDLPGAVKLQKRAVDLSEGEQADQLRETLQGYIDALEDSEG